MAQFLRPDGTVAEADLQTGHKTYDLIDEVVPDDSDSVWSSTGPSSYIEVSLSNPTAAPASGTATVRYRGAKLDTSGNLSGGGSAATITATLRQGASVLATDTTRTVGGSWSTYMWNPDVTGVTDWNDVRLRFDFVGASPRLVGLSWAEMEVPDPPITGSLAATFGAITLAGAGGVPIEGSLSVAFGAITLDAAGAEPITGSLSVSLGDITLAGTGIDAVAAVGSFDFTLGGIGLTADGVTTIIGAANISFGEIGFVGSGKFIVPLVTPAERIITFAANRIDDRNITFGANRASDRIITFN